MAPTEQQARQLVALHVKAQKHLTEKLKIIPHRVMPIKPHIGDIYRSTSKINVTGIPPDLQLPFIFSRYNELVYEARGGARHKEDQDFDISRAIWHYQLHSTHSFSNHFDTTRYNIVLMALISAMPDPSPYCTADALSFVSTYILAWTEALLAHNSFTHRENFLRLWKSGSYDLIKFSGKRKVRLYRAIHKMKRVAPPIDPKDFLMKSSQLNLADFQRFGPAMALQWVLSQREMAQEADRQVKASETGLEGILGDASLEQLNLEYVDWGRPLVSALLTDIDEGIIPVGIQHDAGGFWMDTDKALSLMEHRDTDGHVTGQVTDLLANFRM